MRKPVIVAVILSFCIGGCAYVPQDVKLRPNVRPAASTTGDGNRVYIRVVDERPSSSIGNRLGFKLAYSAEIGSSDDITEVVRQSVATALESGGYHISRSLEDAETALRIEVRLLDYRVTAGFIMNTLRTESALKGICSAQGVTHYDSMYRGDSKDDIFFEQFAGENAEHINRALSNAIQRLVQDRQLLACLSRKA